MIAKTSIVVAAIVLAVTLAFGCAPVEQEDVVVVRLTGHMPIGHYSTTACERFVEEAEDLSNGTLEFVHFPAGQLVMDMPAYEMCQAGGIEMAQLFVNRAIGIIPQVDLYNPYFDDYDEYCLRMLDPDCGGIFYTMLVPGFAEQDLHLMPGVLYGPAASTICKEPIYAMADYEGLKMRAHGRSLVAMLGAWGATGVVMSSADVYMAIQRGTIDGGVSGTSTFVSRKWLEVADYVQWDGGRSIAMLDMIANLDWWNSLSDFHQECIEEALRHAAIWSFEAGIAQEKLDMATMTDAGLEITNFPEDVPEEWDKMVAAALPAIEQVMLEIVSQEDWDEAMAALDAAKASTKTWREVLETIEW